METHKAKGGTVTWRRALCPPRPPPAKVVKPPIGSRQLAAVCLVSTIFIRGAGCQKRGGRRVLQRAGGPRARGALGHAQRLQRIGGSDPSPAAADATASQHHGFNLVGCVYLGHFGVVELNEAKQFFTNW